jgi:hypothetical protein
MYRKSVFFASLAVVLAACASGPKQDSRIGLKSGLADAGKAVSNLKVLAEAQAPKDYLAGLTGTFDRVNSDIAFTGNYAVQGNFNGFQIWDMTNPASPTMVSSMICPASQNDVSVYRNLLFMSVESNNTNVNCAGPAVTDTVSPQRFRGIRIFDISNVREPKNIANVQTCRGSHTHTVLEDPRDRSNVYIYVSGSAGMRSPTELPACIAARPDSNPNSALWRIEIIRVPLASPATASVVNRANIFADLKVGAVGHGPSDADIAATARITDSLKRVGAFIAKNPTTGRDMSVGTFFVRAQLDTIVRKRGGTGFAQATAADSGTLRANLQEIVNKMFAGQPAGPVVGVTNVPSFRQCHDITVYPAAGLAGGACEGHGILLDISDPINPRRIGAVADSNFAYWHSATFNNDGTKVLFSDEWGGGTQAKCRVGDKKEWGSDAIFDIKNGKMEFGSYYKISAPQTAAENCVAHNGSLIPIPGRDVMVQSWYQGGISVFDFTDTKNPKEIAYFDRGPLDSARMILGGSWSAYWYNGNIMSSEIARGLDVMQLTPSEHLTQNEIDASNTVKLAFLNAQGQPKFNWPPSYPLARAYVDQLERNKCLAKGRISAVRKGLSDAEKAGVAGKDALKVLASSLDGDMNGSCDKPKLEKLQKAIQDLSAPIIP